MRSSALRVAPGFWACFATLALLVPCAAAGSIRYAAPNGVGIEPCSPAPCALAKAVNGAADGDQVIVAPGHYTPIPEVLLDHSIDVGGQPGAEVPVVTLGEKPMRVQSAGAVLHDVRIEMPGPAMAYAMSLEAGTVERAYISSANSAGACSVNAGLLRDSVCWASRLALSVFSGEPGTTHADVRNVTAPSTVLGASGGADFSVDARNLIAHSLDPNEADLLIDVNTNAKATFVLSHSNYATVDTSPSAGTNFTYTAPGTNGNQTAPPLFVNAAAGDVHEAPGSPTIDAGASDPLTGALDLDRNPRAEPPCIGGAPTPDIGAYEVVPTAGCPKPSNRFSFGKLKRNRKKGTAKLPVILPGPGVALLSGKGVVRQSKSGSGTVSLLVKAKGKSRHKLGRTGSAKLKVTVTFTPSGGDPATQSRTVKLLKRRRAGGQPGG